jgi:hypothetical protein
LKPAALVLFGKVPLPGRVKTRLAASIGEENAAAISEAFLRDAARAYPSLNAGSSGGDLQLVVAADPFPDDFWGWRFPAPWRIEPQGEGDLGHRLSAAFRREFARFERVAVVGADHPALPHTELGRFLQASNAVWPTRDGGYAALILTRSPAAGSLFEDIPWSTPSVLDRTLARAQANSIDLEIFEKTYDVDRFEDLALLESDLANRDRSDPAFPRETWTELQRIRSLGNHSPGIRSLRPEAGVP